MSRFEENDNIIIVFNYSLKITFSPLDNIVGPAWIIEPNNIRPLIPNLYEKFTLNAIWIFDHENIACAFLSIRFILLISNATLNSSYSRKPLCNRSFCQLSWSFVIHLWRIILSTAPSTNFLQNHHKFARSSKKCV